MLLKSFLISVSLIGALTVSGCAFKKNSDKPAPAETTQTQVQETIQVISGGSQVKAEEFNGRFVAHENLNDYSFVLDWPAEKNLSVILEKNGIEETIAAPANSKVIRVRGGETVELKITALNQLGGIMTVFHRKWTAPKDFEVAGRMELTEDLRGEFNRVVLRANGVLILNGHALDIKADFLVAGKGSRIQNWEENILNEAKTIANSKLKVELRRAEGDLLIIANGRNGLDGRHGNDLDPQLNWIDPALKGANGVHAQVTSSEVMRGVGEFRDSAIVNKCVQEPSSGSPGGKGSRGVNGENGFDGEGTGAIIINAADASDFKIKLELRPGRGGRGGNAGQGRPGGLGGNAGIAAFPCRNQPVNGSQGPNGDPGEPGRQGQHGQIEPFDISPNIIKVDKTAYPIVN